MADGDRSVEGTGLRSTSSAGRGVGVPVEVQPRRPMRALVGRSLPPLGTFAVMLGLWQRFVSVTDVPSVVLPSPAEVGAALVATHRTLLADAVVTTVTAGIGLLVGAAVGIALAFTMTVSAPTMKALLPYVIALRIAPLIAVAPLVFLWFGRGIPARALLVAALTLFPVTIAALDGLRSTPQRYLALARSVAAPPHAVFLRIRVPAAAPSVFAGLKIAATLAVVGAVVAEFVTLDAGLGFRVFYTATHLQTAESYAALVGLSLLGLAFYLVPVVLERLVHPRPSRGHR